MKNAWVIGAVLFGLFLIAYWVPIKAMVITWLTNDDYSYGILIPFISAYLFWDMRSRFRGLCFKNNWWVLSGLIVFIFISIYGVLGSSGNVARPAIPILIILFTAFCFGLEMVRRFFLPLIFLSFMVPLPATVDRSFGVFLKKISSELGGAIVRLSGLTVHVSGNVIDLGVTKLQVVDACNGLRFVFPLLALGILFAYLFEKVRWKQIVYVLSTIPIAILANGLRIGITGVLTYHCGPGIAQGFFHDFAGCVIFMVAFGLLFSLRQTLKFVHPGRSTDKSDLHGMSDQYRGGTVEMWPSGNAGFIVSVVLLVAVANLTFNTHVMPPVMLKQEIGKFPLFYGSWRGRRNHVDPEITKLSGAQQAFSGQYKNRNGDSVSLYMGYRSSAFLENENFFHSPTVCLPASGWKVLETATHDIPKIQKFGEIKVTQMVVEFMGQKQLVYFWFQTKDKATHSKSINRYHLALHAIRQDNTYDLFIRTTTPMLHGESVSSAHKRMDGFVRETMGTLLTYLGDYSFY